MLMLVACAATKDHEGVRGLCYSYRSLVMTTVCPVVRELQVKPMLMMWSVSPQTAMLMGFVYVTTKAIMDDYGLAAT